MMFIIGNLRCGKTERKRINGRNLRLNKEKHIVHENHHEPIISKEDFELAQRILKNRIENNARGNKKGNQINLFTGFLKCGDCNGGFMKINKKNDIPSYICSNYHHYGSKLCQRHKITEEQLKEIILDKLKLMKYYIEDGIKQLDNEINKLVNSTVNYDREIKKCNIKIIDKKQEIKNYSRQLLKGLLMKGLLQKCYRRLIES